VDHLPYPHLKYRLALNFEDSPCPPLLILSLDSSNSLIFKNAASMYLGKIREESLDIQREFRKNRRGKGNKSNTINPH